MNNYKIKSKRWGKQKVYRCKACGGTPSYFFILTTPGGRLKCREVIYYGEEDEDGLLSRQTICNAFISKKSSHFKDVLRVKSAETYYLTGVAAGMVCSIGSNS